MFSQGSQARPKGLMILPVGVGSGHHNLMIKLYTLSLYPAFLHPFQLQTDLRAEGLVNLLEYAIPHPPRPRPRPKIRISKEVIANFQI